MKMKRMTALFLALILIFSLTACGKDDAADPAAVVAKVGDVEITQKQWDAYNALACYSQGYDLSQIEVTEETEPYLTYLKSSMLSSLVSAKLLELDYTARGVDVLGETYAEDVERFVTTVKEQLPDFVKTNKLDDEDLTMYFDSQQYLSYALNEVAVSDEEALAYYEENPDYFKAYEDMVQASHILVEEEGTAKEIIARYEDGEDFADLAAEYGTDATATKGGDLGAFAYGDMVEDFSKAAFALKVGEYSKEPVKSDFGYHVILVTDRVNEGEMQPFDWVKDTIYSDLDAQAYYDKLDTLMETYDVEYFVGDMNSDDAADDAAADAADDAEGESEEADE